MKKLLTVVIILCMIALFPSCSSQPTVCGYHLDEAGNLIIEYDDGTSENLGEFEPSESAIADSIQSISISENGFYVLNDIETDIIATNVFQVNFKSGYGATVASQTVKSGNKAQKPQLERVGYALVGWYCNNEEWHFNSDTVLSDTTLVAKWAPLDYTVSFDTGTDEVIAPLVITYGQSTLLPQPSRTGYTFMGWKYREHIIDASPWIIAANCNLKAEWKANTYTIALNANGGAITQASVNVEYGKSFTLPVPTNEYGMFFGWIYNDKLITDADGHSLEIWSYLENIEVSVPWIIQLSTVEDLQQLYKYPHAHFQLQNDIIVSDNEWIPVGTDSMPFTGIIDGNHHSIIGLRISALQDEQNYYGFIGKAQGGKIFNLTLSLVYINLPVISNTVYVGGVIAYNDGTTLENITVSGTIGLANHSSTYNSYAGGMIGYSTCDSVLSCTNYASVTAKTVAAGIIGYKTATAASTQFAYNINNGEITADIAGGLIGDGILCCATQCKNTGDINGITYAGGLIGRSDSVVIINQCVNTGNVSTTSTNPSLYEAAGGLIGGISLLTTDHYKTPSVIANSYNTGCINGAHEAGGILGAVGNGLISITLENCYNSGTVTGTGYAGGIAGIMLGGIIRQCANYACVKGDLTATISYILISNLTVLDCYYNKNVGNVGQIQGTLTEDYYSNAFYVGSMFWNADLWIFYSDKLPELAALKTVF